METWGKVVGGFMLVMAAMFVVVAVIGHPDVRWIMAATAILLAAGGLVGVPALVRLFRSLTVDEQLLANGVAGHATVVSLNPSGWRYNRYYPIVNFSLNVERDGATYSVKVRQAIDPDLLATLAPGARVSVRVDRSDRNKVVIDLREPRRTEPGDRTALDPASSSPLRE